MPHTQPTLRTYLGISVFNFALAFFWGAMMLLVLPQRVAELVGDADKDYCLGILTAAGAFLSGMTQIVAGAFSDNCTHRLGRRRPFLIFGVLVTNVMLFLLPGAQTFAVLFGVMIGIQLFLNIANGPYQALMPDLITEDHHGRAAAFLGVCRLLGQISGPIAAALLMNRPGGLFILTGLFVACLNLLLLANVLLIREERLEHGHNTLDTLKNLLRVPLRPYPDFLWLLAGRLGIMMGVYTIVPFLKYYAEDSLGVPEKQAGQVVMYFATTATLAGLSGTIVAGLVCDRFSKKRIIYVANSIAAAGAIGFAIAQNVPQALVAVAVYGAASGAFASSVWALTAGFLPPGAPAKYLGFWSLADTMSQVFSPLVAGPLAAYFNASHPGDGYRWLMSAALFYFALGTLAISRVREHRLEKLSHSDGA